MSMWRSIGDDANEKSQKGTVVPFGGLYSSGMVLSDATSISTQINYNKSLGERHFFNLNIGQEASSTIYKGTEGWMAPGYNHEQGRTFIQLPSLFVYAYDPSQQIYAYLNMINWLSDKSNTNNLLASHDIYPDITDSQSNTL